jgi:CzcA family heavy metal efflux pump
MLNALLAYSLRFRVLILVAALLLLLFGIRAARQTPLDVFPEFAQPMIEIQTEAPGLPSEEVESLVTLPLETALAGLPELATLRSKSVLGLSSIVLLLRSGADLLRARQLAQERLALEAPRLPSLARPPVILPPLSATSRALKIGVSSTKLSQLELSDLVRYTLRPRLLAVPGVANVTVWGQRDKQLQVLVDPQRLAAQGVTLDALLRASADATAIGSGGFLDSANQRLAVRHVTSIQSPGALAAAPVPSSAHAALRIGDVADVTIGHAPPIGDAIINGHDGLLLIVEKQPTGNTLSLTHDVEAALRALRPALRDVEIDPAIFRPATFIEQSLHNLRSALVLGCGLVIVVLFLFLRDLRSAAISLTAIPLSLLGAVLVLSLLGGTLNTMFLAGLVIATGEVVDDAIIDVENIRRRLREGAGSGQVLPIVLAAAMEVRSSVVYASLLVCLVFLPVLVLDGVAGAFFRPLAMAYVLSILTSLLVALTVTPALSLMLLPRSAGLSRPEGRLVIWLRERYRRLLLPLVVRPRLAAAITILCAGLGLLGLPFLGDEFLPEFQERDFLMHWVERPGASVEASRRSTLRVSQELLSIPGVRSFGSHIGRAEVADEVVGPNFTEHWISIDPTVDYSRTVARVREVVAGYPGVFRDVLTYLKERMKDVLSGAQGAIVVRIYGPEFSTLRAQAEAVAAGLANIAGVVELKVEPQILVPQVEVRIRPERAALHGLTAAQIRRATSTLVAGTQVGEVYAAQQQIGVFVWGQPSVRADLTALRSLLIETPGGPPIPLREVADVSIGPAPNEIKREAGSRRIDVTCNVRGRDVGEVARIVEEKVAQHEFPRGYHPEFLGEFRARQQARNELALWSLLALLGCVLLLYLDFRSLRLTLLVLATLPFALAGGVLGALCGGGVLSLGSLVGFVSVLGIASRNALMLIGHYRHLRKAEGLAATPELFVRGASERLIPILMTALCAALSLLPIVAAGRIPGYEIEHPMALVILCGLLSSTVLNLLLLPALYGAWGEGT